MHVYGQATISNSLTFTSSHWYKVSNCEYQIARIRDYPGNLHLFIKFQTFHSHCAFCHCSPKLERLKQFCVYNVGLRRLSKCYIRNRQCTRLINVKLFKLLHHKGYIFLTNLPHLFELINNEFSSPVNNKTKDIQTNENIYLNHWYSHHLILPFTVPQIRFVCIVRSLTLFFTQEAVSRT